MPSYKNILTGYINLSKKGGGKYLSITNVSDEDIVIKAGEKLFMNMTPASVREKNPKIPAFSKSIKLEEEPKERKNKEEIDVNDIPF